jgi:hypothetical protein
MFLCVSGHTGQNLHGSVHTNACCSGELISEIAGYFRCVLKTLPDLYKKTKISSFTTSSVSCPVSELPFFNDECLLLFVIVNNQTSL